MVQCCTQADVKLKPLFMYVFIYSTYLFIYVLELLTCCLEVI